MPINSTIPIKAYTGDGVSNTFTYPFKIFKVADLVVSVAGVVKTYATDYSVTGVGSITGGSVVFVIAPVAAAAVLIYRQITYDRIDQDYQEGGDFLANGLDDDLDRIVAQVQQISRDIGRALKLPVDVITDQILVSTIAQRVGKLAGFDSFGNVTLFDPATLGAAAVSAFMATVIVAANVAAAQAALGVYSITQSDANYIAKAFVNAKGDVVGASANDVPAIVSVGLDGQVLGADSTAAAGVSYIVRNVAVRQCAISGALDANGQAAFLTVGAGLRPGLLAAASPLVLTFCNGWDAGGAVDYVTKLAADVGDFLGANLPASNTSYVRADYTNGGAVTYGQTLAPPQTGTTYDRTRQSVLQFAGAPGATVFLDDFGNTWTAQGGAKVQTNAFKFGTGGLGGAGAANALNGAADYVKTVNISTLGPGGWFMRGWINPSVLPGAAAFVELGAAVNAAGFGAQVGIFNNAGTIRFAYSLSSNGTANDIAANVQGTTLPVIGTWYFVELTYDALAGVYRLYVAGAQEASTASTARICGVTGAAFGATNNGANFLNGYIDKPEIGPYCTRPAGTVYAVPGAAPDITVAGYASEWLGTSEYKKRSVTGASGVAGVNPTFTQRNRLFLGECDTSGAAVTAVRSYAYQGKFIGGDQAFVVLAAIASNHNIGSIPEHLTFYLRNVITEAGYVPGDVVQLTTNGDNATNAWTGSAQKNTLQFIQTNNPVLANKTTGARAGTTLANWKMFASAQRAF